MIILYDTTETKFTSNGLGVLDHDIINPIIEESANGTFKLSFDYPLSGICGNRIGRRMYVKADDPDVEGNIFKIYNLEKSDGILSVVAFQVANEFNNNWIEHTNIMGKNGQSALDQMKSNLTNTTRFNFFSDITTTANSEIVRLNPLTWLIDSSTDNSFVNRWGGEIKRDGFNIRMFKQRGSDNGVQIRWRKNLSSYNVKWDDTTVVTRIRPVGYNGLTLPELYVDSPKLANYGDPIIKEVKYDDIKVADGNSSSDDNAYKTVDEAYAALRNAAAKEFSENHLDDPIVTADVSMISLKNTREYADVAELETISQWDTIQLINERDNVDIQMRLNSYKYNPLNHEFTELKFVSANQALTSGNTSLLSVINGISSTVQSVSDTANQAQIAANGKNMIQRGTDDPNNLTFNGTLTDGDIYYRKNGDKKEMWIYSAKDKAWELEVGDMTAQEIADEVAQGKKDADQMRADANARFEEAEKNIADISDDMSRTENDLKSVDAKFDSKTDTLNQSIVQAKSDISDQVDQLKTVKSTADSALKKANNNDSSIVDINQNIDKINGQFDLTATKTDIDTVNKKYTQQQAQIDANTKGITLKASQDSVNTLSQTVTSNSASLSVLSNEVKQKTSKTDFDTLTGRVSNAEQKIDATADGVTSTVSKVEGLQTQVDNSAVGTNLLLGTNPTSLSSLGTSTAWAVNSGGNGTGSIVAVSGVPTSNGFQIASNTSGNRDFSQYVTYENAVYTFSVYAKLLTSGTATIIVRSFNPSTYNVGYTRTLTSTSWTRISGIIDATKFDLSSWNSIQFGISDSSPDIVFAAPKLEKGYNTTDWSANPADNATVTALNVVKQTADETYEGLFNKDGSNKIDVTAQGLKAQIETAKESAQGYAKTTIDAKAGEFNASLSSVQTTLQNDATTKANNAKTAAINTASSDATDKANNALNNAKSYANDKVSDLRIGGNNLIPFSNIVTATSTQTAYDGLNDIRTLTIANGAGGSWGGGIQNNDVTKHEIPWNSYYTYSVEIMPSDSGLHWNSDTNSFPISGSSWNGNDNDDVGNRVMGDSTGSNDRTLIPNVWNKVWVTYKNSNANNKNKVSLYDNSTVGIVNNSGKTVTVKFRHLQGEIGNKPTDWGFSPEDIKLDAQSRADNALNNAKSYTNSKATILQTDYDNKISNTSKEFTEKWTAVTKQVQDSAVGANLLKGTSGTLQTVTNATGWGANLPTFTPTVTTVDSDTTYTAMVWIAPASHDMRVEIAWQNSSGTRNYVLGSIISAGDSGYSVGTGKITAGSTIQYVAIVFTALQTTTSSVSYKEAKLEKGSIATPWCPSFNELATQSYAETLVDVKAGSITTDLKSYTDTQANNAKTAAINTASSDATNKANNALNNARTYADNATKDTATEFSKKLTTATQQINSLGQVNLVPNGGFLTGMTGWVQLGSGGFYYSDADSDTVQGHHSLVGQITGETSDRWYGCASPRFAVRAKQSLSARADIMLWQAISGVVQLQIEWFTDGVTGTNGRSGYYATKCGTSTGGGFKTFKDENFIVPDGVNAARAVIYYQRNAKASTTRIMVTPATTIGEYVDNFVDYTQASTLIDATAGALQAKVNGADYHNLISMDGNGILLDAHGVNNSNKSIILSGDHIKMDSSNPVTIPNAAITELDAGKLKVGSTLNAANVNLINLNADHISSGTLTGVSFHQSSSGHDTWIDGNGVHDYDGSGNNAWIQKGRLQVYDKDGDGFFMDSGKLELSSYSLWQNWKTVKYGLIELDDNILSLNKSGMHLQGTNGVKIDTANSQFTSLDLAGMLAVGKTGSSLNLGADGRVFLGGASYLTLTGGTKTSGTIAVKPYINVGVNDWPPNGTGGDIGANIYMQANGIWLSSAGETHIDPQGDLWFGQAHINTKTNSNSLWSGPAGGWWMRDYSGAETVVHAQSFANSSLLSKKTNITKLDPAHALSLINKTDIYDYQYKNDVENNKTKHYASFIIDDVNEVSEYTEPDEFLSEDKTGRDDGTQLAYATLAIQELSKQIDDLKQEIKNIKQK